MSILKIITTQNNNWKINRDVELNQNLNIIFIENDNTNYFKFNKISERCKSYYNPHRWFTFWTF